MHNQRALNKRIERINAACKRGFLHNPCMQAFLEILSDLLKREACVLVRVARTEGSVPREVGAAMAVSASAVVGSVGGGQLEWQAVARARELLAAGLSGGLPAGLPDGTRDGAPDGAPDELRRYPLGPALAQCCGGVVHLCFERLPAGTQWPALAAAALARGEAAQVESHLSPQTLLPATLQVALFGAGHVGAAIVDVLSLLPCRVCWIDSRDEVFPAAQASRVNVEHSAPVHGADAHAFDHINRRRQPEIIDKIGALTLDLCG